MKYSINLMHHETKGVTRQMHSKACVILTMIMNVTLE